MPNGEGPVAIVTGASSPIGTGAAIARRLAAAGWRLLLVADGPEAGLAQGAAAYRAGRAPEAAEGWIADLGDAAAATGMVERALARFGRVDALVNNAALRIFMLFGEFSAEDFDRAVAVNLRAPFLASRAVAGPMRRQGGGRIVNIASQLGSVTYPTRALYGLTKAGLIHLTKPMALELVRDNIAVNAISPAPIETAPSIERARRNPAAARDRLRYIPMGRMGRPEEVAEPTFLLLTTSATFRAGHNLIVDGGYTLHEQPVGFASAGGGGGCGCDQVARSRR
ncbi:hypothetical protein GCM10010964_10630 [Caldovatus sediminis]|uniref:SDR family oxidoreductase n=1 Tax=Caldovatus sediminis TaxID=2041189 RepID=A0A8J2ZA02_9PROT|nr:SDR family oxidoreductase [Caldovatus sediminis]GGG24447.1 hypothetical protein GCM10010964_10630 [Caldovatus sediminis]